MPTPGDDQEQRDVLWRLVDTQCSQLADAVVAARRPFLLALTWTFVWASALYTASFGHNKYLRAYFVEISTLARTEGAAAERLEAAKKEAAKRATGAEAAGPSPAAAASQAQVAAAADAAATKPATVAATNNPAAPKAPLEDLIKEYETARQALELHCRDLALVSSSSSSSALRIERCRERVDVLAKQLTSSIDESMNVTLPGGLGKFSIGDLAIIGQFGLLLILSWSFFATRRENHAVRAFVDIDAHSRNTAGLLPTRFILEAKSRFLQAQHLAIAYKAVAQRFMFLFSAHSRPLMAFTVLLVAVPALVATWNAYTDLIDLFMILRFKGGVLQTDIFLFKTLVEVVLLVLVWLMTLYIVRFELDTSTLLNGWQLAVQDVWMATWASAREPPVRVEIDARAQTARIAPPAPA